MKVIGYGSLMNSDSLARTIKPRKVARVIVKGYKRIYNIKASRLNIYPTTDVKSKVAVLNAVPDKDHHFNAIVLEVSKAEFEKLKERERIYHVEEAPIYDYATKKEKGKAKIFVGKKEHDGYPIIFDDILPIPTYYNICLSAAFFHGKEFGNDFLATTYLADGKSIKEYVFNLKDIPTQ